MTFTKKVETATISCRGEKVGSYGPGIPIRVSGPKTAEIGSQVTITTWVMNNPNGTPGFEGWFDEDGHYYSSSKDYTFTVTGDITLIAKWIW